MGSTKNSGRRKKIKHLQQGLGAIKQILLSGKTEFFLRRFHEPNKISGLMDKREYIFQYVPKLGVEVIAVCGLVGMCTFLVWEGKSQQEVTYMLGLLATAGFRLIPSFSRILNNLQCLHYGWASTNTLADAFSLTDKPHPAFEKPIGNSADKKIMFDKEITFSKMSFSYNNQSNCWMRSNFL